MSWDKQEAENKFLEQTQEKNINVSDWFDTDLTASQICCLVYGQDGTAKSGTVLDYEKCLKDDEKMVVIDLDANSLQIIKKYHTDAISKKKILYINPYDKAEKLCLERGLPLTESSAMLFEVVDMITQEVRNNYKNKNYKCVVFDGLSSLLKFAEKSMRLEKHLDVDGGVQMRFWMVRNDKFLSIIKKMQSLPIAKFFISHDDFIIDKPLETSSVVKQTNAMVAQKIRMERKVVKDEILFRATFDKIKEKTGMEGASFEVCKVNTQNKDFVWNTDKVFEVLK